MTRCYRETCGGDRIDRPRSEAPFLASADKHRRELDPRAAHESPDAFGSAHLVACEASCVGSFADVFDSAKGLDGVDVQGNVRATNEIDDLRERLNGARFMVDGLNGHEMNTLLTERALQIRQVYRSVPIDFYPPHSRSTLTLEGLGDARH
jgi:hypothetical protein